MVRRNWNLGHGRRGTAVRKATTAQLRRDIESGGTGDKVPVLDPAASPLGTDAEAAGRADAIAVLEEMAKDGTLAADWRHHSLEVLNKADLLGGVAQVGVRPGEIAVSVLTGEGLPALAAAIDTRLSEGMVTVGYDIPTADGAQLAWLYGHGEVIGRQVPTRRSA
jgi:GTPase